MFWYESLELFVSTLLASRVDGRVGAITESVGDLAESCKVCGVPPMFFEAIVPSVCRVTWVLIDCASELSRGDGVTSVVVADCSCSSGG